LPHRYRASTGFDNPSIYCSDLLKLISRIQNWVVEELPREVRDREGLAPVVLSRAKELIERATAAVT
jgi:uncharacterized protein